MYGRSKDNYKKGILPQENINGYIVAVKLRFGVDILISKSKKKKGHSYSFYYHKSQLGRRRNKFLPRS